MRSEVMLYWHILGKLRLQQWFYFHNASFKYMQKQRKKCKKVSVSSLKKFTLIIYELIATEMAYCLIRKNALY